MYRNRDECNTGGDRRSHQEAVHQGAGTEEEALEKESMDEETSSCRQLSEKLKTLKEKLREIQQEDQVIMRRLLEGYKTFLSSFEDTQPRWSSTMPRHHSRTFSDFSACAVSTNYRLELIRKFLRQEEDLNIRDIATKLYPPLHVRTESGPPFTLRHSSSLEESFLDTFSYDGEELTEMDPLSMSSIT